MPTATALDRQTKASTRSHMPFILAIAILARVGLAFAYYHANRPHSLSELTDEDIAIARSIWSGQGFSSPFSFPSGPTAFIAPGYPLIIAGFMLVLGDGVRGLVGITAFEIALSVVTVAAVMILARQHFGQRTANLAGLICAVLEPMLLAPMYLWDTCLSALMLTIAMMSAAHLRSKWHFVAAGLGSAFAGLVNPSLLPTLFVIFAWSAWRAKTIPWIGILTFLVAFSPWPIRNYKAMHAFVPLRSNFGYELWLGNHEGGDGNSARFIGPVYSKRDRRIIEEQGELAFMRHDESIALAWITAHPAAFAELTAKRFIRFWAGNSRSPTPMTVALVIGGILGLALMWRSRSLFILYAIPLVIYPLPYYITHADLRYQFVIDPLLAILAGYACESMLAWIDGRKRPLPAVPSQAIDHSASA